MQQPRARATIRDVAEQAGVSVATVSKVINNRYGVAADTAARVQAVISELGYEASLVAQSLRNHRTNVIGILVADLEPFSTELLKGAADAIRGSGFELVVYSAGGRTGEMTGWERRYLSRLPLRVRHDAGQQRATNHKRERAPTPDPFTKVHSPNGFTYCGPGCLAASKRGGRKYPGSRTGISKIRTGGKSFSFQHVPRGGLFRRLRIAFV